MNQRPNQWELVNKMATWGTIIFIVGYVIGAAAGAFTALKVFCS